MTSHFLSRSLCELRRIDFITDNRAFAPYRHTLNSHVDLIDRELREYGYDGGSLMDNFIKQG